MDSGIMTADSAAISAMTRSIPAVRYAMSKKHRK